MRRTDRLYIGTNTKMYKTISDTVSFVKRLSELTSDLPRDILRLFVIPSFTALEPARKIVSKDEIMLGAQNMGWEDEGQFTGEISPLMLKEVGADMVEIGHSERRHILGESDEMENKKVLAAVRHNFAALLCVGETAEQKKNGIADEIIRIQIKIGLNGVEKPENILIAYEPVWAIGVSGVPASKEYADEKHSVIKKVVDELFGKDTDIPILYGGSVNNGNAEDLIGMPNIDGLFIGRSAWDASNFNNIIRSVMPIFLGKKSREDRA